MHCMDASDILKKIHLFLYAQISPLHFTYLFFAAFVHKPDPNSRHSALLIPLILDPAIRVLVQQPVQPFEIGEPFGVHVDANAVFAALDDSHMFIVHAFVVRIIRLVLYFICDEVVQFVGRIFARDG